MMVVFSLMMMMMYFVNVAFITLLERKVLGAFQRSSGPNLMGLFGLLQPFADGLKLLLKELVMPMSANMFMFLVGPLMSLMLSLVVWVVMPFGYGYVMSDLKMGILYVFAMGWLSVYSVLMSGWSSNSKYAFFGGLRSSAQMISYEVSMGLMLLIMMLMSNTFNMTTMVFVQTLIWNMILMSPCFILFFMSILAETNSTPFDLSEAEGELVAGFNVEYSGMGFTLFFMAEYLNMMMMSLLVSLLFFGGWLYFLLKLMSGFWFSFKLVLFVFVFMWMSGSLPSYSYNQLMVLGWKVILPLSFSLLMGYFGIEILLEMLMIW